MSKSVNQISLEELLAKGMGFLSEPSEFDKEWLDAPAIGKEFPCEEDMSPRFDCD